MTWQKLWINLNMISGTFLLIRFHNLEQENHYFIYQTSISDHETFTTNFSDQNKIPLLTFFMFLIVHIVRKTLKPCYNRKS